MTETIASTNSLPKIHKVRHKETGLYYKPGKTNLSERGKIYTSNQDCINCGSSHIYITIEKSSKIYKKYEEYFKNWVSSYSHRNCVMKFMQCDEFEKEYLFE